MPTALADIRTWVRDQIDEPTAAFWSNTQLNRLINEGLETVYNEIIRENAEVAVWTMSNTYPANSYGEDMQDWLDLKWTGANTIVFGRMVFVWQLPDGATITLYEAALDADSSIREVIPIALAQHIVEMREVVSWLKPRRGAADYRYTLHYGDASTPILALWPVPSTNVKLTIHFVPNIKVLSGDTDIPSPHIFHEQGLRAVAAYAAARAMAKRDSDPSQHWAAYERLLRQVLEAASSGFQSQRPRSVIYTHDQDW